ncbi:helix-turn-helix domain-containing protein [Methylovulum psychrotolerans]|uniref:Helix-turn-helix domain-containing protein n=1 Tax=Methylovulum psychrotolerans TaxID=1704499 RepID=A0A2S5CKJ8_9GAMM|nr:helix-turn-helix domain-containing protein [Methylovulum psychrotolerans]POZ51306.1 helix-turn-helix domain-containing protein [Methylovulum psychrotolerans]
MTTLNERILKVRKYKSLKQNEFAELIGVSRSTLSEVESGKTKPSTDIIVGIANSFDDVNTDWLLTGKGDMYRIKQPLTPISEHQAQVIVQLYGDLNKEQQQEILSAIQKEKRLNELAETVSQLQKKVG